LWRCDGMREGCAGTQGAPFHWPGRQEVWRLPRPSPRLVLSAPAELLPDGADRQLGSYSPALLLHVVNRWRWLLFALRHPIDEQRIGYRQHHRADEEPGDAERDEPTDHAREDQ